MVSGPPQSDQLIDWIYEHGGTVAGEAVPIMGFANGVGLDTPGAFQLLNFCTEQGLVDRGRSTMGNPVAVLTPFGMQYARSRQQRRSDPAQRARTCRSELLRWFYRQRLAGTTSPVTEQFAWDPAAAGDGSAFSPTEIDDAAEYLADKDLVKGVNVDQARGPIRAEITNAGIDCVIDWEGDIAQYLRDQRGYGPTYHGPVINGNADRSQFTYGNRDVIQTINSGQHIAPGFEALAEAVATLLAHLPTLELTTSDREDVEAVAAEVLAEIRQPEPQPGRVRRAVAALRGFLAPVAAGVTAGVTDESQELTRKIIDHLAGAIG